MGDCDDCADTAADVKVAFDLKLPRIDGRDNIVGDAIGDCFVERTFVPIGPEVELEALELNAELIWYIRDLYVSKVWLSGFGAETCELWAVKEDLVILCFCGIGEGF